MTAFRLIASIAIMLVAGVLLFVAGFGVYFAFSTAMEGVGGGDERERFISAVIEASSLLSGVALQIAGTAVWQRISLAYRALLWGIGLMLIPGFAAWLVEPDRLAIPIGQVLALALPLSLLGLAMVYWLYTREDAMSTSAVPRAEPVVEPPGRKRRIAAFIIALVAAVPLVPLIFPLAALSFNPLEASDEPNVWGGIAVITFGIGMVALVIAATFALVHPQRSMLPCATVAAWFTLSWLILFAGGSGDAREPAGWLVAGGTIAVPLFLGWLSQVPHN